MDERKPPSFSPSAENAIAEFRGLPAGEPPRMRRRPTRELASVLEEIRVKYRIGRDAPEDAIRNRWPEIVGAANAAFSQAARLDQGGRRLIVLVDNSVVRSELFLHRDLILERLRQLPGCSGVKILHIRTG